MARQLGERLVAAGVLTRDLLAQALERQRSTGQKLGECLVRLGVDETPLLRLLAQDLQTRFVSTEKLAQARIDPAVLERVPVRLAEELDLIPLRFDERSEALYVAMAEPQRADALAEAARQMGVKHVVPFVAVRRSVRAAIRRHYYSDPHAFEHKRDEDSCPHCGAPASAVDFQCPGCELLLVRHVDELPPRDEGSLIRAFLSIPERTPARGAPRPPHRDKTIVYSLAPHTPVNTLVPSIVAGFALVEKPLHPFEAYILSMVDGRSSLAEISLITGLAEVELRAVFESLVERGVVKLDQSGPRPRAASRPGGTPAAATVSPDASAPAAPARPPAVPVQAPRPASPSGSFSTAATPEAPVQAPRPASPSGSFSAAAMSEPAAPRSPPVPPVPRVAPPVPPASAPRSTPAPTGARPPESGPREGAIRVVPPGQPDKRQEDATESILQRVVALERAGRVDEAIELLKQAISTMRRPAPLYNRLALILVDQRRDYEQAVELLRKAVELDPETSVYMMNLYAVLSLKAEATDPGQRKRKKEPPPPKSRGK